MIDWNLFHFIRPYWLITLIPLLLGFVFLLRTAKHNSPWIKICDQHLLNHLLVKTENGNSFLGHWLYLVVGIVLILAVAGPTWEQSKQPVYQSAQAKVFILDLSLSMKAEDISPTRLTRAKLKLLDMLALTNEGQSALIVFASTPFVVSPLTEDADTIAAMIPTLDTDLMPAQGSRAELALEKASALLFQSNIPVGSIYLLTDGVNEETLLAAEALAKQGHSLSVLAVGTENGAPIPYVGGGFVNDAHGAIVIPRTNFQDLSNLAERGNGYFISITADDSDVNYLLSHTQINDVHEKSEDDDRNISIWKEAGPWVLLFALPFFALAFRRGWLVLLSFIMVIPISEPVYAMQWNDFWNTKNQQAEYLYQSGNSAQAALLFEDPSWKATAYYKSGNYQKALEYFSLIATTEGYYNKGNTLAKLGRIAEAINEYEKVLEKEPRHEDAKYNLEMLKKQQEKQQQDPQQEGEESDDTQSNNDSQKQEGKESDDTQSNNDSQKQEGKKSDDTRSNNDSQKQEGKESDDTRSNNDSQAGGNEKQLSQADNADEGDKNTGDNKTDAAQENQSSMDAQEKEQSKDEAQKKSLMEAAQKSDLSAEQKPEPLTTKKYEEQQQALEQWLRRIPDDPGGLLREKFLRQFQRGSNNDAIVDEW